MREEPNTVFAKIRTATFWTGIVLIIAGVTVLLGLATVAVDIIKDPEGIALVKWLAEKTAGTELFLSGHFDQAQFGVTASPALQYIFLALVGLILMNILAAIVRSLISVGAQLIQFAGIQYPDKEGKKR
ncbi:MAG: hypothetical protein WGN25_20210 [Candidatus Electrothrix sp. GW3-4]|uniref:hypothetical protein n=1 Tax=Candidatus Electrothrix sp. GW3-4 TaxID=3126740 RepID=UPI0030D4E9E7